MKSSVVIEGESVGTSASTPLVSSVSPVRVRFWGVRSSVPMPGQGTLTYGGNTTCVELRAGGEIIVLDAGSGIHALGQELIRENGDKPLSLTVLLTHTRWDHIQGIPFFSPVFDSRNTIRVLGYQGSKVSLKEVLCYQMDGAYFPLTSEELLQNLHVRELREMAFNIGRVPVQSLFVNHPGNTLGYRFSSSCGVIVYFPDIEILPTSTAAAGPAAEFNNYKNQLMAEFARGAEIFICNAAYTAAEYVQRTGKGRSCVDQTVALALAARAKHLVLFNHDAEHDDEQISSILAHARELIAFSGSSMTVEAAAEGSEIRLAPIARSEA